MAMCTELCLCCSQLAADNHLLAQIWPLPTAPVPVSHGSRAGTQRPQEGAPGEALGERRGQECRHEGSKQGLACLSLREGTGRALRPCQLKLGALERGRQRAVGSRSSAALTAEAAARAQPAGDTRPARGHPQGDPALGPAQAAPQGAVPGQGTALPGDRALGAGQQGRRCRAQRARDTGRDSGALLSRGRPPCPRRAREPHRARSARLLLRAAALGQRRGSPRGGERLRDSPGSLPAEPLLRCPGWPGSAPCRARPARRVRLRTEPPASPRCWPGPRGAPLQISDRRFVTELSSKDSPGEAAAQDDPLVLLEDSRGPEDDVFISQYATGQKEALRAALETRVIPVHKEVKVQLLGSASTEKREGAGDDTRSAPREVESATTIAAATAAAIATTAPLLKVQNDLEAKVNSVSELLQKLQETDRQLQRASEQQKNVKAQHEEPHYHQRVSKLEKQMNAFMVQRIQHLEKLQEQQMNIQSHLISSAVNTHGLQLCPVPVPVPLAGHWEKPGQRSLTNEAPSSHRGLFPATAAPAQVFPEAYSSNFPSHGVHTQKSPLKTPVPRRYAPEPVPKNGKISEKENSVVEKENISKPTREGEGKGLEHVLNSQETPLKQVEYSKKAALNSNERSWHSERHRHKALPPDAVSSFESYSSIEKTVQKADNLLQDLGKLRREMHNILQEATTWKSDMNDLIKAKNPPVAPDPPEHHLVSKPSILQNIQVPRSILTDAERILRGVQNNKKVLEENLEAVSHAKDGDAMYAFSNSLTTNRDVLEEICIRRTVDERIKEISEEIQIGLER
ncbi:TALPID3 protein-like [Taeniopygia guttata]|uniref:TALPID3 protein-like n=1 Tax=Taeniopygia guttata TaxID=59729 RepID=UPI003BB90D1C